MAWALIEGLAGVVDTGRTFDSVRLSPRWAAAEIDDADVSVGYEASQTRVAYQYRRDGHGLTLTVSGSPERVHVHLLLPAGRRAREVSVGGHRVPFSANHVEASSYVDVACRMDGAATVAVTLGDV